MSEERATSPFVQEILPLWTRYYLSTAQRRVVDLLLEHDDDLRIPRPSRGFLYQTALDAMVLDLVVLWDKNGEGSLLSVAKRLSSTPASRLEEYTGQMRIGQDARSAAQFVNDQRTGITDALDKLITARNKTIAHLDRPAAQQPFEVTREEIDAIQAATLAALLKLDGLVHAIPVVGGGMITQAGENLVQELRKPRRDAE
ncbi:MAG: hypothetical protein KDB68_09690 [Planctomycetes bacterium]|nr:hypothetical protein [Planctomycetota bacterium]